MLRIAAAQTFKINFIRLYIITGVEVSLDALNELLALLAHEGSGNKKASQYDKQRMIVNWQPSRTGKSSKAGLKALNEIIKKAEPAQTGQWYYVHTQYWYF